MRKIHPAFAKSQTGAALVTSLLILLMLTVIGVAAMQMTSMQERMAGNSRDLTLAFQGAEAALRNGENMVRIEPAAPTGDCTEDRCEVWSANLPLLMNPAAENTKWWNDNALEFQASGTGYDTPKKGEITELEQDPQFIVQYMTDVKDSLTEGEGSGPPPARYFYRVTARSSGASGKSNTVLQSTYARR